MCYIKWGGGGGGDLFIWLTDKYVRYAPWQANTRKKIIFPRSFHFILQEGQEGNQGRREWGQRSSLKLRPPQQRTPKYLWSRSIPEFTSHPIQVVTREQNTNTLYVLVHRYLDHNNHRHKCCFQWYELTTYVRIELRYFLFNQKTDFFFFNLWTAVDRAYT